MSKKKEKKLEKKQKQAKLRKKKSRSKSQVHKILINQMFLKQMKKTLKLKKF